MAVASRPRRHSLWAGLLLGSIACLHPVLHAQTAPNAPSKNGAPTQAPAAAEDTERLQLLCEAIYLPVRSVWPRRVELQRQGKRLQSVQIDGQPVYAFALRGALLLTSLDNERIQIDLEHLRWQSDFRGLAQGQGDCKR